MIKRHKNYLYATFLPGLLAGFTAFAQTSFTGSLNDYPGGVFTVTNLLNLVRRLTCYFIQFGIISVVVAMVIYGIMILASRGNSQGFSNGRKALTWGLVGGLLIFSVFTIILSVASLLGVNYPILT